MTAMETPVIYIATDVPAGQTLGEWRRALPDANERRSTRRVLRHLVRMLGV